MRQSPTRSRVATFGESGCSPVGGSPSIARQRLPVDVDEHEGLLVLAPVYPDGGCHGPVARVESFPHPSRDAAIVSAPGHLMLVFLETLAHEGVENLLRLHE